MPLKHMIKLLLFKTKLYKLSLLRNRFHILPYHMVVESTNGYYPETSLEVFNKHMAHIAKNYKVIDLNNIVERINKKKSLRRCMAITFDDGFRDNYEVAYPVLRKYNLPATIFLTTGYIDSGTAPWFIKFRYVFMKTEKTHFELSHKGTTISLPTSTRNEKFVASDRAMACLKNCPDDERLSLLERLCEELEVNDLQGLDNLMLTWDQIREMAENGISFGAHTVNHPILSRTSVEMAEREIQESKRTIEKKLKKPVSSFAYPFGKKSDFPPALQPIIEKLQFKCAVTTETDENDFDTNLFSLNRNFPWEMIAL